MIPRPVGVGSAEYPPQEWIATEAQSAQSGMDGPSPKLLPSRLASKLGASRMDPSGLRGKGCHPCGAGKCAQSTEANAETGTDAGMGRGGDSTQEAAPRSG